MQKRIYLSPPHMCGTELELVQEVFRSNWIAPVGPMLTAFEAGLSKISSISRVVALSSGTAALHLALRLCGVGPRDHVWSSTLTFIGGVSPIVHMGATPLFFDVDRELLIDLDLLEEQLRVASRNNTLPKAVISTDLYGQLVNSTRVKSLSEEYGFTWISDSAEAVGSRRDGVHSGKGAHFAIFSFNGNKIITTSAGGALASDNHGAIDEASFLATQAREAAVHYEHKTCGYNYRLSNVCAAIGVGQLGVLDDRVNARRKIFEKYRYLLDEFNGIDFIEEPEGSRSNRWLTVIRINPEQIPVGTDEIRIALEKCNIESRPVWKPMHMQPVFSAAPVIGGAVAQAWFERGLCLPSGSMMTDAEIEQVVETIIRAIDGHR